jgi:hypothetical protein
MFLQLTIFLSIDDPVHVCFEPVPALWAQRIHFFPFLFGFHVFLPYLKADFSVSFL